MIDKKFQNRFRDAIVTVNKVTDTHVNYDTNSPQRDYNQYLEEVGDFTYNFTMPKATFNKIYQPIK